MTSIERTFRHTGSFPFASDVRSASSRELMRIDSLPELVSRSWQEIAARPTGPFAFRFYLRSAMAVLLLLIGLLAILSMMLGTGPFN